MQEDTSLCRKTLYLDSLNINDLPIPIPIPYTYTKIRSKMLKPYYLSYYKPNEPLEVQCESSQAGLGAALMQGGHPIFK